MNTFHGAGAIIPGDSGSVFLVLIERRGMCRWELPSALSKDEETLLETVFRCVEDESGIEKMVRPVQPACLCLHRSDTLDRTFFGMFFECEEVVLRSTSRGTVSDIPERIMPDASRQHVLKGEYCDWKKIKARDIHPLHQLILQKWEASKGELFSVYGDADAEVEFFAHGPEPKQYAARPRHGPESAAVNTGIVELRWVHVSDSHVRTEPGGHSLERDRVLAAIVTDIQERAPESCDFVFVTGDVVSAGKSWEFQKASEWLRKVSHAANCSEDQIRVVAGNHDIDRDRIVSSPMIAALHKQIRVDGDLDSLLQNNASRAVLKEKMDAYDEWLGEAFPNHPKHPDHGDVFDWIERHITAEDREIAIAGLCTVWTSDEYDGVAHGSPLSFVNNACISAHRLARLLGDLPPVPLLLLTHHPESWLVSASQESLRNACRGRQLIHLSGHTHDARAGFNVEIGDEGRFVNIIAGPAHGERDGRHGYAWGALRFKNNQVAVGWAPRVYTQGEMRADFTRFPRLDSSGFAWWSFPP